MIPRGLPYDEAMRTFRWNVPERFNIGRAVCERHESVRLHANGAIHVSVRRDGADICGEDVAAERCGPEVTAAFNPAYLGSLLAGITGPVRLGLSSEAGKSRCVPVTPADESDPFRSLVMSISIPA